MNSYTKAEAFAAIMSLLKEQDALIDEHRAVSRTVTPNSSTEEIRQATKRLNELYGRHQAITVEIQKIRENTASESIN